MLRTDRPKAVHPGTGCSYNGIGMTIETWEPPIDFREIVDLLRELMPEGKHLIDGDESRIEAMSETYDEEVDTVRIAREDDRVVGFARYKPNPPDADATVLVQLWEIAVLPEYRRRGRARQLMEDVADQCARVGYRRIWSRTFEDNLASIAFHRALGFSILFTKGESIVWERVLEVQ